LDAPPGPGIVEELEWRILQAVMEVVICMLRGVNLVRHNRIRMSELRALCRSLGLQDAQTYVNSGNVVFRTEERDLERLAGKIQKGRPHN
jgi:uncharacterized protein (DUF1697 family)